MGVTNKWLLEKAVKESKVPTVAAGIPRDRTGVHMCMDEKDRKIHDHRKTLERIVNLCDGITDDETSWIHALIGIKDEAMHCLHKYKLSPTGPR